MNLFKSATRIMTMISTPAILFFVGWRFSRLDPVEAAKSNNQAEAEKLLKQAEALTDIRSPGSHAFRLTARVKLLD